MYLLSIEYAQVLVLTPFVCLSYATENFLTGLRIVFDRERMVLGWKKFNCKYNQNLKMQLRLVVNYLSNVKLHSQFSGYEVEKTNPLPVNPRNTSSAPSATPPSIAFGPQTYTPEASKEKQNNGTVTVLTPGAASSHSSLRNTWAFTILMLLLLPLFIL